MYLRDFNIGDKVIDIDEEIVEIIKFENNRIDIKHIKKGTDVNSLYNILGAISSVASDYGTDWKLLENKKENNNMNKIKELEDNVKQMEIQLKEQRKLISDLKEQKKKKLIKFVPGQMYSINGQFYICEALPDKIGEEYLFLDNCLDIESFTEHSLLNLEIKAMNKPNQKLMAKMVIDFWNNKIPQN